MRDISIDCTPERFCYIQSYSDDSSLTAFHECLTIHGNDITLSILDIFFLHWKMAHFCLLMKLCGNIIDFWLICVFVVTYNVYTGLAYLLQIHTQSL